MMHFLILCLYLNLGRELNHRYKNAINAAVSYLYTGILGVFTFIFRLILWI